MLMLIRHRFYWCTSGLFIKFYFIFSLVMIVIKVTRVLCIVTQWNFLRDIFKSLFIVDGSPPVCNVVLIQGD